MLNRTLSIIGQITAKGNFLGEEVLPAQLIKRQYIVLKGKFCAELTQ